MNDAAQLAAKLFAFDGIYIEHPYVRRVLDALAVARASFIASKGTRQRGLLIQGRSFAGKTTCIQKFIRKCGSAGPGRILHFQLSPAATTKQLWIDILTALGDPLAYRGSEPMLKERAYRLLRERSIEMMVFDEVHHLIAKAGDRTRWRVTETLKVIIDDGIAAVVLVGTLDADPLFHSNDQLNNRLSQPVLLEPLRAGSPEDMRVFIGFLDNLARAIRAKPISIDASVLKTEATLRLLLRASSGVIGVVSNIVRVALAIALSDERDHLVPTDIDTAVERWALRFGFAPGLPVRGV